MSVYALIKKAIIHTPISECTILILVINLTGKSSKNPASAIGVQNTKKDQVNIVTDTPSYIPYLKETKIK